MARTKIGIIGAGNMGRAFATRLAAAGHSVSIAATDPAHAEEAAAKAGANARAVRPDRPIGSGWLSELDYPKRQQLHRA